MTLLAVLLGWIVFLAAGDLVGRVLAPSLRDTAVGRCGVALLLGPGTVAFACFVLDLAGFPLGSTQSYSIALVVVAAFLFLREERAGAITPSHASAAGAAERTLRIASWTMIVGCVVLGAAFAVATPPYKDSLVNWSYKTLVLWRDGTVRTNEFLVPDRHLYHANYPLLVPLAQVFVYGLAGEAIDRAARAFQCLHHLGIALVVYASFAARGRSTFAVVAAALVATIPHFYRADVQFRFAGSVPSGYADPTYTALSTAVIVGLAGWFDQRRPGDLRFAACCLGLALFTKNEAIPFAVAGAIAFAIATFATRQGRLAVPRIAPLAQAAAVVCAIAIPWLIFRSGIPERDENYQHLLTLDHLLEGAWRVPVVLLFSVYSALSFEDYGLTWVLCAGALVCRPRALRDPVVLCSSLVIAIMAAIYAAVFVVTPLPIVDSLATSIPRTFFHLSPIAIVLAARIVRPAEDSTK